MGKYMCCLCGQSYDNAEAYARCVKECAAKEVAKEEKRHREELEAVKASRIAEITETEKKLSELKRKFNNDYGYHIDILSPFDILFG